MGINQNQLKPACSFRLYETVSALPNGWEALAADNIFLSAPYLEVLEQSAPENMSCHFIGIFDSDALCGIAVTQFLNLNKLDSFGNRDQCLKTMVRDFVFRNFASHVLFVGNNMLTGQHAFVLAKGTDTTAALLALRLAAAELRKKLAAKGTKVHLTTYKDFDAGQATAFDIPEFSNNYRFSTQPNMVLEIRDSWKTEQDYVDSFQKKYRDQYKRARKKSEGIEKRKLNLGEIIALEDTIYNLYLHVARHAPFNSFYLSRHHFRTLKEKLKEAFRFYGYFQDNQLVGFSTLIKNGKSMETYFLGYDESVQREKMLYLNMLYDMIAYSIKKGFSEIIFARTALEIKSSVGAQPTEMFGFIEHQNKLLNKVTGKIFDYVEPKTVWQQRHPFK